MFSTDQEEADSCDRQKAVLDEALDKFFERNGVHQDLWKDDDLAGTAQAVKSKAFRVLQQADRLDPTDAEAVAQIVDDALDGINYLCFLVRKARGEV